MPNTKSTNAVFVLVMKIVWVCRIVMGLLYKFFFHYGSFRKRWKDPHTSCLLLIIFKFKKYVRIFKNYLGPTSDRFQFVCRLYAVVPKTLLKCVSSVVRIINEYFGEHLDEPATNNQIKIPNTSLKLTWKVIYYCRQQPSTVLSNLYL